LGLPPERLEKADLLSEERVQEIEEHMRRNIYFSNDWSLPFYLAQAYHGFIATAYAKQGQPALLLPEMQLSYAVLQHEDLHISRKSRRRAGRYRLTIDQRLDDVLAGVKANHENCWVTNEYETLLRVLNRRAVAVPVLGTNSTVKVHSIELLDGDVVVAGEIGYAVGAVYVSLTGFFNRTSVKDVIVQPADQLASGVIDEEVIAKAKLKHDGAGTVQLVALGRLLQRCGFSFWDLGHPPRPKTETREACMMYKADIGAKVLQRDIFLKLWKVAREQTPHMTLNTAVGPDGVNAKDIICGDTSPAVLSTDAAQSEQRTP